MIKAGKTFFLKLSLISMIHSIFVVKSSRRYVESKVISLAVSYANITIFLMIKEIKHTHTHTEQLEVEWRENKI